MQLHRPTTWTLQLLRATRAQLLHHILNAQYFDFELNVLVASATNAFLCCAFYVAWVSACSCRIELSIALAQCTRVHCSSVQTTTTDPRFQTYLIFMMDSWIVAGRGAAATPLPARGGRLWGCLHPVANTNCTIAALTDTSPQRRPAPALTCNLEWVRHGLRPVLPTKMWPTVEMHN
jgi:hypothetical protein